MLKHAQASGRIGAIGKNGGIGSCFCRGGVYNGDKKETRDGERNANMTVQELYERVGGSYENAKRIMMNDALIGRFVGKLTDDGSFARISADVLPGTRS